MLVVVPIVSAFGVKAGITKFWLGIVESVMSFNITVNGPYWVLPSTNGSVALILPLKVKLSALTDSGNKEVAKKDSITATAKKYNRKCL